MFQTFGTLGLTKTEAPSIKMSGQQSSDTLVVDRSVAVHGPGSVSFFPRVKKSVWLRVTASNTFDRENCACPPSLAREPNDEKTLRKLPTLPQRLPHRFSLGQLGKVKNASNATKQGTLPTLPKRQENM